jgi:hypothetical protein
MDHLQFLQSVELTAGLDRDGARRAAAATLLTLAERLGQPAAGELARSLPPELREPLDAAPETAEAFDAGEFVRRIAAREGGPADQAGRDGRCSRPSRRTSPPSTGSATGSRPTTRACSSSRSSSGADGVGPDASIMEPQSRGRVR